MCIFASHFNCILCIISTFWGYVVNIIFLRNCMKITKLLKILVFVLITPILLSSCAGPDGKLKIPGGDARKTPADPKERVKKNLEEGKGFTLNNTFGNNSGKFDFASSNELWRASLDVIDFMPLSSVNYSGESLLLIGIQKIQK